MHKEMLDQPSLSTPMIFGDNNTANELEETGIIQTDALSESLEEHNRKRNKNSNNNKILIAGLLDTNKTSNMLVNTDSHETYGTTPIAIHADRTKTLLPNDNLHENRHTGTFLMIAIFFLMIATHYFALASPTR
jgi:hypothetical protein